MNRKQKVIGVLSLLTVATLLTAPFLGMENIAFEALLHPPWDNARYLALQAEDGRFALETQILWTLRIPRVLVAFLAGSLLGLGGMAFQALFRNPLATPYTLGVASGASLGAAAYVSFGVVIGFMGIDGLPLAAFAGALLAMSFVYGITHVTAERRLPGATLLLAGVAMSFFFSSLILLIQYLSDFTNSFRILRWLMGGLEVVGFTQVWQLLPFALVGSALIFSLNREFDLLLTGESVAMGRGVRVDKVKKKVFLATSLMIGGVVAFCGPIGFVGMMAPHMCRLLLGPGHSYLAPATFLLGGIFLTWCDTLARTLISPAEMPVGVITALLGGPFFLWLLLGRTRGGLHVQ